LKAAKGLAGWLDQLGAGGGTPLLAALTEAGAWLAQRRKRYPAEQQRLLVITDGRLKNIDGLPLLECPGVLVDIERGPIRLGRSQALAVGLQLDYRHIDDEVLPGTVGHRLATRNNRSASSQSSST